jgi:guanylate kinase
MGVAEGKIFVISGPSGVGKSTLIKELMTKVSGLAFSVSHTTRAPRKDERDGTDYHFVTREEFEALIDGEGFAEWAKVHGRLYGTSFKALEDELSLGHDVILDIDVQGAGQIAKRLPKSTVRIFIAPPSVKELERRLVGRGEERDLIDRRVANARGEMDRSDEYDYVIVNQELAMAVGQLCSVVKSVRERARAS